MFKEFNLENFKKVDIQEVGNFISTKASNIKEEFRDDDGIDKEMIKNEEYVSIPIGCLYEHLIDEYDYECDNFDEIEFLDFVEDLIKKAEHYLIVAYKYNWRGQTGVKITNSLLDCFYREYDCSQYVIGGSKGKKILSIKESHHDNPMGSEVLIIALTDKEYEDLENASWEKTIAFGDKMRKKVQYI